jgi:(S)-2-hydroxyglutarate dehydrogenase
MFDFAVIGGGIVGLSTARALLERHPGRGFWFWRKNGAEPGTRPGTTAGSYTAASTTSLEA